MPNSKDVCSNLNYVRQRARRVVVAEFEGLFVHEHQNGDNVPDQPGNQPQLAAEGDAELVVANDAGGLNGVATGEAVEGELGALGDNAAAPDPSSSSEGSNSEGEAGVDDEDDDVELEEDALTIALRNWAVKFKVSHAAIDGLIEILRPHHPAIPDHAKKLLATPAKTTVAELANGQYCHIGLHRGMVARSKNGIKENVLSISLDIFVDAFKTYKTVHCKCTAILGRSLDFVDTRPFVIGIFYGTGNPEPIEEFLQKYIEEAHNLSVAGIDLLHRNYVVVVKRYLADALGRAYLKGIVGHASRHGCERCNQVGVYLNQQLYETTVGLSRTDESFRTMRDAEHHKRHSPLAELNTGFISQFPLDPMHLLDLGVFKRFLKFVMFQGPLNARMTEEQTSTLRNLLHVCADFIPLEFTRKPALERFGYWRAAELKMVLLYLGPVLFAFTTKDEVLKLFLLFHHAVFIMHCDRLIPVYLEQVKEFLRLFVQYSAHILSPNFVVYNVHSCLHLHEDVERHGKLSSFAAYPFEDMLGQLKKLVRSPNRPLQQLHRRLEEREKADEGILGRRHLGLQGEHRNGPLPHNVQAQQQYSSYNHDLYTVTVTLPNNCVGLSDGSYGLVVNIFTSFNSVFIAVKVFQRTADLYDYPRPSRLVGACVLSDIDDTIRVYNVTDLLFKCFLIPMNEGSYGAVPLVHLL